MIGLGYLAEMILGDGTVVTGLGVSQTTVPSMSVTVARGAITDLTTLEATAYGSIGPDTTDSLLKMGINWTSQNLGPFTAPVTAGQSVNILVQAAFLEADTVPVVIPYYNASNPAVPFSGPSNSGATQNTRRKQTVALSTVVGTAATTGTQVTPTATATPLAVITIANGASSIVNANIAVHPACPRRPGLSAIGSTIARTNLDGTIEQFFTAALTTSGAGTQTFSVALPDPYPNVHTWAMAGWGGTAPPSNAGVAASPGDLGHVNISINCAGAATFGVAIQTIGH